MACVVRKYRVQHLRLRKTTVALNRPCVSERQIRQIYVPNALQFL
jgi:hypothetical protein